MRMDVYCIHLYILDSVSINIYTIYYVVYDNVISSMVAAASWGGGLDQPPQRRVRTGGTTQKD